MLININRDPKKGNPASAAGLHPMLEEREKPQTGHPIKTFVDAHNEQERKKRLGLVG